MGQRREDFQRFLGDALLLVAAHVPQGPHVVQAVGQLDDDDPHVLGHGQKHLAHAVELLVFLGPVIETAQFRNAVDEEGDFLAEEIFQIVQRIVRIFDDIVQKRRRNGPRVDFHIRQNLGHSQRMEDIGLAAGPVLFLMGFGS